MICFTTGLKKSSLLCASQIQKSDTETLEHFLFFHCPILGHNENDM